MKLTLQSVYRDRKAIDILYELLRIRSTEDDPHTNISHRRLPPMHDHAEFYYSKPYRLWFLIKVDGQSAGSLSVTRNNEIGIVLFPAWRGRGIAKQALQMLIARHKPLPASPSRRNGGWLANINPRNARSIALFEGLAFKHIQNTYEL